MSEVMPGIGARICPILYVPHPLMLKFSFSGHPHSLQSNYYLDSEAISDHLVFKSSASRLLLSNSLPCLIFPFSTY